MDYSLLLLVYKKPTTQDNSIYPSVKAIESSTSACRYLITIVISKYPNLYQCRGVSVFRRDSGGYLSSDAADKEGDELYHMAIIDTLQPYNWRKLLETRYKGIFENEDALSCVDPKKYRYHPSFYRDAGLLNGYPYSERFVSFLRCYAEGPVT